MNERPMNPIIELAFSSMSKAADGSFTLDALGARALEKSLHALIGKAGFEETIFDLWALANYLEEQLGAPAAATGVRGVVFSLKEPLSKLVSTRKSEPTQLSRAVADLIGLPRPSLPQKPSAQTPGTKWWQVKAG